MEIATRNVIFPGSVGLAQAHPLTKPLAMGDGLPRDLVQLRSTLPIRALVLGRKLSLSVVLLVTTPAAQFFVVVFFPMVGYSCPHSRVTGRRSLPPVAMIMRVNV